MPYRRLEDQLPPHPSAPRFARLMTRRRLLALTALAAAAAPLGIVRAVAAADGKNRPSPADVPRPDEEAYQRAFERALAADENVRWHRERGREFLYRPRQILVADADVGRVVARLRQEGLQAQPEGRFGGVTKLLFNGEVDVPAIIVELRDPEQWRGEPVPRVQPHHVLVGFGNIMGNPGSPPRLSLPLPPPDASRLKEGAGVTVGVCDTGIWPDAGAFHPAWLGGTYAPEADDADALFLHDDVLALQGGHGTFVAGVVRQAAPGASLDPERALDQTGIGDEAMLVGAIGRLAASVSIINLSLGCFTQDDVPSLPLANAVAALPSKVAVVASAGNSGIARPSWPAALERVVAVAAVAEAGGGIVPAQYSNFGSWVDASAIGERTSTYVKGRLVLPGVPEQQFAGFASWAGTSFAAPHVAGRLAAIMTANGVDAGIAVQILLSQPRWHPDYGVLVG
jgi:subtilisin family serine protease